MNQQQPLDRFGLIMVSVFGLLCVAGAVWTSGLIFPKLVDAAHLRNSVTVPAQIKNIERETVSSGDGTTTIVFVTYSYEFLDEHFEHRTRTLTAFAYDHEILPKIEKAYATGSEIPCHVDPDEPSRSLLSKEFNVLLLGLSLLFPIGLTGASILIARGLWKQRKA